MNLKAKSIVNNLILCIFLFLASFGYAATDLRQFPPEIKTDAQMVSYILYLRNALPEVFQSGGSWYVDPKLIIDREQKFLTWLKSEAGQKVYQAELQERKPFQDIHVQMNEKQEVTQLDLSLKAQEQLRNQLINLENRLGSVDRVIQEIFNIYRSMQGQSSMGLMTGMIQALPAEQKATAFKLPLQEKMEFLLRNISDSQLKLAFKSQIYSADQISVHFLSGELKRLLQHEEMLAELNLYLQQHKISDEQILNRLQSLDAKDAKKAKDLSQALASTYLKSRSISVKKMQWVEKEQFQISEVSPHLGIYRGCINGDCFTTYAYGYTYSPSERTFLVRDSDGKLLTSVYATEVKVNGIKSLYIHEIGNASLRAEYGSYIFQAIYQARHELGFEQVILGNKGMHHYQFASAAKKSAQSTDAIKIEYYDSESRELIGNELVKATGNSYSKGHDMPSAHATGLIYVPVESATEQIQVQTKLMRMADLNEMMSKSQISDVDQRSLFLDLVSKNQIEMARLVLQNPEVTNEQVELFLQTLLNQNRASVEEYYAQIKTQLATFGIEFNEQVVKDNLIVFIYGQLNSQNSWQGLDSKVSKMTLEMVVLAIKKNPEYPIIKQIVSEHPEILNQPALEKVLRSFLKDNQISLAKAKVLLPLFAKASRSQGFIDTLFTALDFKNSQMIADSMLDILLLSPHTVSEAQIAQIVQFGLKSKENVLKKIILLIEMNKNYQKPSVVEVLNWASAFNDLKDKAEALLQKISSLEKSKSADVLKKTEVIKMRTCEGLFN